MSIRLALLVSVLLIIVTPLHAAPKAKPVVVVLATGGTIAGAAPSATQTVGYKAAVVTVDNLLAAVPSLKDLADVRGEQIFQIASENITPEQWRILALRVNSLLADKDVSGVVITHGTDTMEETAYFLNLVIKSEKPVVLVGSMRPSTAISADGPLNLYNAVAVAAAPESSGKGVFVVLNDTINPAREVTKGSTFSVQTFHTPDLGALGYVQSGRPLFYRQPLRRHTVSTPFNAESAKAMPKILILYGYAGSDGEMVEAAVKTGAAGIVYAGTGNGSLSDQAKKALAAARKKGVQVVRSSRTGSGMVARNGEVNDDEFGFIAADNLTPQKARVLLMLGLAVTTDTGRLQEFFQRY